MTRIVNVKVNFCIAYCYETIIFQYAIVTDRAGVQPIGMYFAEKLWLLLSSRWFLNVDDAKQQTWLVCVESKFWNIWACVCACSCGRCCRSRLRSTAPMCGSSSDAVGAFGLQSAVSVDTPWVCWSHSCPWYGSAARFLVCFGDCPVVVCGLDCN